MKKILKKKIINNEELRMEKINNEEYVVSSGELLLDRRYVDWFITTNNRGEADIKYEERAEELEKGITKPKCSSCGCLGTEMNGEVTCDTCQKIIIKEEVK